MLNAAVVLPNRCRHSLWFVTAGASVNDSLSMSTVYQIMGKDVKHDKLNSLSLAVAERGRWGVCTNLIYTLLIHSFVRVKVV